MRLIPPRLLGILFLTLAAPSPAGELEATQELLSISGHVWEDRNADGVRQPDEPGLQSGISISGPMGEVSLVAAEDGSYSVTRLDPLDHLPPGQYVVKLQHADGLFFQTAPVRRASGPYQTSVTLGSSSIEDLDFGLVGILNVPTFSGLTWKDAERFDSPPRVQAFIGEKDCTGPGGILPTDQDPSTYQVSVASATILPGCGVPGDVIRFRINGEPANETAVWEVVPIPLPDPGPAGQAITPPSSASPGQIRPPLQGPTNRHRLDLTIGPAFAWWIPFVAPIEVGSLDPEMYVDAFVDGTFCGRAERPGNPGSLLVVPSADLEPGCGADGATVTFEVKGEPSTVTAEWRAGSQGELWLAGPSSATGIVYQVQVLVIEGYKSDGYTPIYGPAPDGTRVEFWRYASPPPMEDERPLPEDPCANFTTEGGFAQFAAAYTPDCQAGDYIVAVMHLRNRQIPITGAIEPQLRWGETGAGEEQPVRLVVSVVGPQTGGASSLEPNRGIIRPPDTGDAGLAGRKTLLSR